MCTQRELSEAQEHDDYNPKIGLIFIKLLHYHNAQCRFSKISDMVTMVLSFYVEFRELSHLTRDLSQAENVVTS